MRQWHPQPAAHATSSAISSATGAGTEESLDAVYPHLPPPDRDRWVVVNMVTSVDGGVTLGGVSGPLGAEGDLAGFRALRAAVDVVVVGAGTARAEGYGPAKVRPQVVDTRRARGQADRPAIAVVTRSLDLEGADRLFAEGHAPLVITAASSPPDRRRILEERGADVLVAGEAEVDLALALALLADRGLGRVLVEGGPRLNRDLFAAGLVDEVFVTIAPLLVGQEGPGIVGSDLPVPLRLELLEGRLHRDELLLRYRVRGEFDPRG